MLHLPALIVDLAIILGAAAIITLIFKRLRQPVVLGYIIAGLLVGPNFKLFPSIIEIDSIRTWADIGVLFLLFGLGLEFSFKKLIKVGGVAVLTAITGVSLTMALGYAVGRLLGWNGTDSLFLGGILAIASTTIIIRAFDELGVKNQKFAGIVTGVLIIEDLAAVLLMILLSTVAVSKTFAGGEMLWSVLKLAFFLILWFVSGIFFLPTLFQKIGRLINEETLLIISLALCFLMAVLATYAGFSPALGAFIMGSILAETTKAEKIEHLTKSVKNLFGAIFFVSVGMLIDPKMLVTHAIPILAATLVLLIGKPVFVTMGAVASGQPLKTAVQSGMSLSQIGEFSFIIATLGLSLKVTSGFLYPVAVAVSVITTFLTPYMIRFSGRMYKITEFILPKKWTSAIETYSISTQNVSEISDWKKVLRSNFINISIFSVVIITIIIASTQYLAPWLYGYKLSRVITASITLAVLSPFLWALAFRRTQKQAFTNIWMSSTRRGPLTLLLTSRILLAIFYIGFLFDRLFSPWIALGGAIVSILILTLFISRIKNFYRRIETRFLTNFHERETLSKNPNEHLTPWDTHISTVEISGKSELAGKTLAELKIRERFGVNVVVIERDDIVINVPGRETHIYPHDKLAVIGTDEQIKNFELYLQTAVQEPSRTTRSKVSLHHFTLSSKSPLLNKTIRESRIRERTQGLIVGIERCGDRILNPESDMVFMVYDKVWIVGNEKRIQIILKEITG